MVALAAVALAGCGGGGGSGGGRSVFVTGGGASHAITATGGTGTAGGGGDGGSVNVWAENFATIEMRKSGAVNTAFSLPQNLVPYLGDNPLEVSVDTTLRPSATDTLFGTASTTVVATGLWVKPGVTLTIQPNEDNEGSDTFLDQAHVIFDTSVYLQGTIRVAYRDNAAPQDGLSDSCADLFIECESFVSTPGSSLVATGKNKTAVAGGNGGDVDISAENTIVNRGTMDTSGGSGTSGGDGGDLVLTADYYGLYNTGAITTNGGAASAGVGGDAGNLELEACDNSSRSGGGGESFDGAGGCFNSAHLSARGGDGTTGGGEGGYVELYTNYVGAIVNSGNVDADGGDATVSGSAGDGDEFYLYCYGGVVRLGGTINVRGGTGSGTASGGEAGDAYVYSDQSEYFTDNSSYNAAGMYIGATFHLDGGDGVSGGDGDYLYVYHDIGEDQAVPGEYPLLMVGYSGVDLSGGDGTTSGGDGGDNDYESSEIQSYSSYLCNYYTYWSDGSRYGTGSVINEVNWTIRGGDASNGEAGQGGDLEFSTYDDSGYEPFERECVNSGAIDLRGGAGTGTTGGGGSGGEFYMWETYKTVNTGSVNTSGGNGPTYGGDAGHIWILSEGDTVNAAGLSAFGGATTVSGTGGDGADVTVAGWTATSSGNITAHGGDGIGFGGDGGEVDIFATQDVVTFRGTANVAAGEGDEPDDDGEDGTVRVDGIAVRLVDGVARF